MKMKDMVLRIANGAHSGADTRAESVGLLEEEVAKIFMGLAGVERIETLDRLAEEYGIAFEVNDGMLSGVMFE